MCIVWTSLFLASLWLVLYLRLSLMVSTVSLAGVLVAAGLWGNANSLMQTAYWLVFLLIAVPLNVPMLRRTLISDRVFSIFKKIMPTCRAPSARPWRQVVCGGTVNCFPANPIGQNCWTPLRRS